MIKNVLLHVAETHSEWLCGLLNQRQSFTCLFVSKRAYRTLETFSICPPETAFFFNKSLSPECLRFKLQMLFVPESTRRACLVYALCLFVVAAGCGACSLSIAQHIGGEDKENEEEKKNLTKDEDTRGWQ